MPNFMVETSGHTPGPGARPDKKDGRPKASVLSKEFFDGLFCGYGRCNLIGVHQHSGLPGLEAERSSFRLRHCGTGLHLTHREGPRRIIEVGISIISIEPSERRSLQCEEVHADNRERLATSDGNGSASHYCRGLIGTQHGIHTNVTARNDGIGSIIPCQADVGNLSFASKV